MTTEEDERTAAMNAGWQLVREAARLQAERDAAAWKLVCEIANNQHELPPMWHCRALVKKFEE